MVVLYHYFPTVFIGGYWGVILFFVLSGHLISSGTREQLEDNSFSNKRFLKKRFLRIMPSMFLVYFIFIVVFLLVDRDLLHRELNNYISSLFQVNNWNQLMSASSYFDKFNRPSIFKQLWSVSVEFQFYLFWLIILSLNRKLKYINHMLLMFILLSLICSFYFGVINPELDNQYYRTDTRIFPFLMGCLSGYNSRYLLIFINRYKRIITLFPYVFFLIIGIFIFKIPYTVTSFTGYTLLISLLCLLLIYCISSNNKSLFSIPLLVSIGKISYEIYLVHFPIIVFFNTVFKNLPLLNFAISLSLIYIFSKITYILVKKYTVKVIPFFSKICTNPIKNKRNIIILIVCCFVYVYGLYTMSLHPKTELQIQLENNQKYLDNK